jgi:deoxyribodipyrimidine photo-lyase
LIKDFGINWQLVAEYFESLLIDYDPASNYGNWNYLAGVGSDPVENRYFNILSQAQRYDPEGAYVKHWLPQLLKLPKDKVHRTYDLDQRELEYYNVQLNDYHRPVIEPNW